MTDLRDLLDSAAGDAASPTPDVVAADLRRGRRALLRQRYARTGAGLLLTGAAVAAGGSSLVPQLGDEPAQTRGGRCPAPAAPVPRRSPRPSPWCPSTRVRPPSRSLPGSSPTAGRSRGNEYALVIAPAGNTTSPDDFQGKLVVMLSPDQTAAPGATSIDVAGAPGTVSVEHGTQILVYTPDGHRRSSCRHRRRSAGTAPRWPASRPRSPCPGTPRQAAASITGRG